MLIYLITNTRNGKVYVGKTEKTLQHRWRQHLRAASAGSPFRFHKAIRKHGPSVFARTELCRASSSKELDLLERTFILICRSMEFSLGYNSVLGGGPSDYNRQCTSQRMRAHPELWPRHTWVAGEWLQSSDTKHAMSRARRGAGNSNAKLSERQVGAIRRNPADLSVDELAELYKVCPSTIDKVRARDRWPSVDRD